MQPGLPAPEADGEALSRAVGRLLRRHGSEVTMRQRVVALAAFSRAGWALGTVLLVTSLVVAALPLTPLLSSTADLWVTDMGQLVLAAAAAVTTGWRARRTRDRLSTTWLAFSLGCGAWAAGQAVWNWYELGSHGEPFPSAADLGFLLFPLGAVVGLARFPRPATTGDRRRSLLDSLLITIGLTLVSWATALGAVVAAEATDRFAFLVSLAYPTTDLLVLSLLAIVLGQQWAARGALTLLAAGITGITVGDSAFAYFTAGGSPLAEHTADVGWVVGFALLAVAPLRRVHPKEARPAAREVAVPSTLPYLPILLAALVVGGELAAGHRPEFVETTLLAVTVVLVLLRQHSVMKENSRLATALSVRESQLRHQAFHDALTGLANRALFRDRVAHALELHRRDLRGLAVLFCDLDDFKLVNDTLGHRAGDELLVRVAERLRGALRGGDTLARLGGDEFAVLLEDGGDPWAVARQVIEVMQSSYTVDGRKLRVQGSLGLAVVEGAMPTPDADVLMAQADTAMYAAKRAGKGCFRVFAPGMELDEVADEGLRRRLAAAIKEGAITLHYQPITDLKSGTVQAFEALARWHEGGAQVPPDVFIPAAERMGLIGELTAHVLDLACAQVAAWDRAGARDDFTVAVNVSPHLIVQRSFPDQVLATLDRHRVAPSRLVIEITESGLLVDFRAAKDVTRRLNALGIRLSLDDFGVGYSSLTHLSQIPLQSLKIDQLFVAGLGRDAGQTHFTEALLHFAADLGLEVIAEGIERAEQLRLLRDLGCDMGQGFLLGRAAPAASWTLQLLAEPGAWRLPEPRRSLHAEECPLPGP
jgi:diguanylate cyclase (GGDEF)-like protein